MKRILAVLLLTVTVFTICLTPSSAETVQTNVYETFYYYAKNSYGNWYVKDTYNGGTVGYWGTSIGEIQSNLKTIMDAKAASMAPSWTYSYTLDSTLTGSGIGGTAYTTSVHYYVSLYYYQKYNVSYSYTGYVPPGVPPLHATAQYQDGTFVPCPSPTVIGYTFSGWSPYTGSFIMPKNDVTLTGYWMPNTNTPYTVEIYKEN